MHTHAYRFARTMNGRALFFATLGEAVTFHSRIDHLTPPPLPSGRARGSRTPAPKGNDVRHSRFAHYLTRPILRIAPIAFALGVAGVLGLAWWQRDEGHLTAESGVGYWLGIAGAMMMLVLIGYPMRKRLRSLSRFGRVANWFRLHMIIGILGPALVVLHTNFKLGSLNSRLALLTMLIVVASGIVGRYIYAKVHKGLYGQQLTLRDVHADIVALAQGIHGGSSGETSEIDGELQKYLSPQARGSVITGLASPIVFAVQTRASRRRILRAVKRQLSSEPVTPRMNWRQGRHHISTTDAQLRLFFLAVRKAERLAFFEGLLGMWHHLHMPLFVMLFLTVVIHIIAVHLY